MNRAIAIVTTLLLPVAFYSLFGFSMPTVERARQTETIHKALMTVWSLYDGSIESAKIITITSKLGGKATVIDLVAEGKAVKANDLLVRFDATDIERKVLNNKKEHALAKSELERLVNAGIPLEVGELELELLELRNEYQEETDNLEEIRLLVSESLASKREIERQETKVAELKVGVDTLMKKLRYTKQYIHPSEIEKAKVNLNAAEQALNLSLERLENTVIRAPIDGIVVYKPLNVNREMRPIRIGDGIYANQPFMMLPNMDALIVRAAVPESELSRVKNGNKVVIRPIAYPELALEGSINRVSSIAQTIPGRPTWQRYFLVDIQLHDSNGKVKPGMSATVHVLTYHKQDALVISRSAVFWEGGEAFCRVAGEFSSKKRRLSLGMANDSHFEVVEGVKEGEKVATP